MKYAASRILPPNALCKCSLCQNDWTVTYWHTLALTTWNNYIECLCHTVAICVCLKKWKSHPHLVLDDFQGLLLSSRVTTPYLQASVFWDEILELGSLCCFGNHSVTGCSYSWRLSSNRLMARLSCRWLRETESSSTKAGKFGFFHVAPAEGVGWSQPSVHGSWTSPNEQSSPSPCGIGSGSPKIYVEDSWFHMRFYFDLYRFLHCFHKHAQSTSVLNLFFHSLKGVKRRCMGKHFLKPCNLVSTNVQRLLRFHQLLFDCWKPPATKVPNLSTATMARPFQHFAEARGQKCRNLRSSKKQEVENIWKHTRHTNCPKSQNFQSTQLTQPTANPSLTQVSSWDSVKVIQVEISQGTIEVSAWCATSPAEELFPSALRSNFRSKVLK